MQTIVAAFQVEPEADYIATRILPRDKLCYVVRHDGCTHVERGVACMQSPGYARGIVDDGTMGDAHIASEGVREDPSPAPDRIYRDRAVRYAEHALVREAAAMRDHIVAAGAVSNAYSAF